VTKNVFSDDPLIIALFFVLAIYKPLRDDVDCDAIDAIEAAKLKGRTRFRAITHRSAYRVYNWSMDSDHIV